MCPAPSHLEKNYKYRLKSITHGNLTEVEAYKSAAVRKAPFEIFGANASRERDLILRRGKSAVTKHQRWEDLLWQRSQFTRQWTMA
jgi:hypothetical protein